MRLKDLLKRRQPRIEEEFFRRIAAAYPEEAASILSTEQDPFLNPMSATIRQGAAVIVHGLLNDLTPDQIAPSIEQIVRIRAVQDFTPSEAVSFVFLLKEIVSEELQHDGQDPELSAELNRLASRFDALALKAFDAYVACKESIMHIRIKEAHKERDRLLRLLQALNRNAEH